jgi:hypothetical protein
MAVILTQNPNPHNFAYGVNAVTLSGIPSGAQKYLLQIRDSGGTVVLATLRQSKNASNVAQFDIQNVLQSYVSVPATNVDGLGIGNDILTNSPNEVYEYILRIGHETNGVITLEDTIYGTYQVVAGTKKYYQIQGIDVLEDSQYRIRPLVEAEGQEVECYTLGYTGNALSNVRREYDINALTYANPTQVPGDNSWDTANKVWVEECRNDERLTKSFWNQMSMDVNAPATANHIGAFQILVYNGSIQTQEVFIPNLVSNGGGPNTAINSSVTGSGENLVITMGIGPANLKQFSYRDDSTVYNFLLDQDWTHYYITPVANQASDCGSGTLYGTWGEPLMNPTLIIRKEESCLDFDPIRFQWVNEYGFLDYYSFDKKNVKTVNTKRNTYLKEANNYDSNVFDIRIGQRGVTTYSQKSEEQYEANTGYMTDAEAETLQYLFRSADVRVQSDRFGTEEYLPVVLLDTRWKEKTNRVDQLFQYTVRFKLAHNIKTQRG